MKVCFKCGQAKPLSEFYKHKKMADGHLNKCIPCTKKDVFDYREENLAEIKLYDKKRNMLPHRVGARKDYAQTENGKRVCNKAKIDYSKRNPEKRIALLIANRAKRSGEIKVEVCEKCGSLENLQMHHEDYSKPLDVIVLCAKCHKKVHAGKENIK